MLAAYMQCMGVVEAETRYSPSPSSSVLVQCCDWHQGVASEPDQTITRPRMSPMATHGKLCTRKSVTRAALR